MTNIVLLRDVQQDDLATFFEQQLDPEANALAAFPARDEETFHAHWKKIMREDTVLLKTILFDGKVAGNMVSFEMSDEREVGYWIGKEFWGNGIATQALKQFLEIEKTRPLYAYVAKHNVGSRRVLEKCGFTMRGEDKHTNQDGDEVEEIILKLEGDN